MIEKREYVCGFCGETHTDLDSYMKCVSTCGNSIKKHQEEERQKKYLEEVNAALNAVKQAKKYYEDKLNEFKTKYPKEYEINFAETCSCGSECKCNHEEKTETYINPDLDLVPDWMKNSNSLEVSYENNGNGEPKMYAKVNGKKVKDDELAELFVKTGTRELAEMLGII